MSLSGSLMSFGLEFLKHNVSERRYFSNSREEGDCRVHVEVHGTILFWVFPQTIHSRVQRRIAKGQQYFPKPYMTVVENGSLSIFSLLLGSEWSGGTRGLLFRMVFRAWFWDPNFCLCGTFSFFLTVLANLAQCCLNLTCMWITWRSVKMRISDAVGVLWAVILDAMVSLQVLPAISEAME